MIVEGIEFLEDDVINLLETKGIHTIEDLGDYSGEDNLVLELQFLVKNRLEKLKHKLNKIKNKPVLEEGSRETTDEDPILPNAEKEHSIVLRDTFRLSENTIIAIAELCKKYKSQSTENNPKTLLECVLNVIVKDVLQKEDEFDEMDLSIIFQETAELSGIPSSIGFIYNLENIGNHPGKKKERHHTILDKHLQQLQLTAEGFVYNELFSRLLERKISRERQQKRIQ